MNMNNLAASLVEGVVEVSVRFKDGCNHKDYSYLCHTPSVGEVSKGDHVLVQSRDTIKPAVVSKKPTSVIDINLSVDLRYVVSKIPDGTVIPIEAHVKGLADKLKIRQANNSRTQALAALGLTEDDAKFLGHEQAQV